MWEKLSSNHRSKSAANTTPSHKWKIEVDEINVKLNCTNSNGTKPDVAIFKLSFKLDRAKDETLFQGSPIDGEVIVTLEDDNGITLWPKELTGILIKKSQYGSSLGVSYFKLKSVGNLSGNQGRSSTILNHNSFEEIKFVCNFEGAKKDGGERELYRKGYLKGSENVMIEERKSEWKVNLHPTECSLSEEKNITICNLKVTNKD